MKTENADNQTSGDKEIIEQENSRLAESISSDNSSSELTETRWSVVTFEKCAGKNLTYEEAVRKLEELQAQKVSGLCIVTDEAAKKIEEKK